MPRYFYGNEYISEKALTEKKKKIQRASKISDLYHIHFHCNLNIN